MNELKIQAVPVAGLPAGSLRREFAHLQNDQLSSLNVDQKTLVLQPVIKLCRSWHLVQVSRKAECDAPDVPAIVDLPFDLLHAG